MKTVSIIIPVYNVEKYLVQCLDSILNQTYKALEIILIDDGSTDASGEICESYAKCDSRIKLIHQENAGAANAKNAGLNRATGDYITFIDSDDYAESDWIEKMVVALEKASADVVECSFLKEYTDHTAFGNPEGFLYCVFTGFEYMAQYLDKWTNSLFWNKLFKAELTKNVRFHRERRCIDDEFYTYKVVGKANTIVRIDEHLYHYRQRKSGAVYSPRQALQRTVDALDVMKERYQWIGEQYPELKGYVIEHDVKNLHYFAQTFPFSDGSATTFLNTVKEYLNEAIRNRVKWSVLRDTVELLKYNRTKILLNKYDKNMMKDALFD